MKLFIVRHGQTRANLEGTLQGQTGAGLSETGLKQVRLLAKRLRTETLEHIFSSDLQRALETTHAISVFHQTKIQLVATLREWDLGNLSGQPVESLQQEISATGGLQPHFRPAGGESLDELIQRAGVFAETVLARHAGKNILVVSHGMFNRALIGFLLKQVPTQALCRAQDNACLNVIEQIEAQRFSAKLINCTRHLDPLKRWTKSSAIGSNAFNI